MKFVPTALPGVLIVEPHVFGDERGLFFESWSERKFAQGGIDARFVQDNHSRSARGVLRGLHYQIRQPQGKLIRVVTGRIFDVVVDIRKSSPTFGSSFAIRLDSDEHRMLWVPPGLAHGFCVLSDVADVLYKATDFYAPEHERTLLWSDPVLGIRWPVTGTPTVSAKDAAGVALSVAEVFP